MTLLAPQVCAVEKMMGYRAHFKKIATDYQELTFHSVLGTPKNSPPSTLDESNRHSLSRHLGQIEDSEQ